MTTFLQANFISRLNLAQKNHQKTVRYKNNCKIILYFLEKMCDLGIIRYYRYLENNEIEICLKYFKGKCVFKKIEIVSTPGLRIHVNLIELIKFKDKYQGHILLVSTSQGYL
jgi:ribosomal protein S8